MEIDAKTQQPLSPLSPVRTRQRYDLDPSSTINNSKRKKRALPPLGLSREQLQQRIGTLTDYPTYKKTKAKRIDLHSIEKLQKTHIVSTAFAFGAKQSGNEVLLDFIKNYELEQANPQDSNVFQQLLKGSDHHRRKSKHQEDPSFIHYKSPEEKKTGKVKKILTAGSIKQFNTKKVRALTEPKQGHHLAKKKSIEFPKELRGLKDRLQLLPSVSEKCSHQNKEEMSVPVLHYITEDDERHSLNNNTSKNHHQSQLFFTPYKKRPDRSSFINKSLAYSKKREDYLTNIKTIIDRSGSLLSGKGELSWSKRKDSALSEMESLLCSHQAMRNEEVAVRKKERRARYWPSYPQYSVSLSEIQKLQKMAEESKNISKEGPGICPSVVELEKIMRQQISLQQSRLDKEMILGEVNSLGSRFSYLMELERQNYRRNVKGLVKCKKEYFLEKRREEIRANGIKRMKKFGEQEPFRSKAVDQEESEEN